MEITGKSTKILLTEGFENDIIMSVQFTVVCEFVVVNESGLADGAEEDFADAFAPQPRRLDIAPVVHFLHVCTHARTGRRLERT